ncbi:energy-coupling factor transporter ATPase [Spiroplasma endosymbiont of Amphibalanus improvisus]|uniref:energy-coupling factor transporter ATPase n=1 Tax=Spiroplasma endosymbiont of Amphibalanus improvisus TaxID=3066327 RepID=UPI00313DF96D
MSKNKKIVENLEQSDIKFKEVSFIYAKKTPYEFQALKDINLLIEKQKITAIIGSTGSGKSTLIQTINGLIIPTSGEVWFSDYVISAKKRKLKNIKVLRKTIGLVFQFPEYQLFEETIEKDIIFGPVNLGISKNNAKEIAKKYIDIVGLSRNYLMRSPFNLSGGQKRRVAIAGILAMEGNTLILDEPTAGLDPEGEKAFLKLFKEINEKEKRTIVLVTHNMDHVLELADEVIVLDKGQLITKTNPDELFSNKELLEKLNIELPKIYNFIHLLKNKGLDLTNKNIRTIPELSKAINQLIK